MAVISECKDVEVLKALDFVPELPCEVVKDGARCGRVADGSVVCARCGTVGVCCQGCWVRNVAADAAIPGRKRCRRCGLVGATSADVIRFVPFGAC